MHYCELFKGLNCLNNEVLGLVFSPALIKVHEAFANYSEKSMVRKILQPSLPVIRLVL